MEYDPLTQELHAIRRLLEDGAAVTSGWGRADADERERIIAIPNTPVRRVESRTAELLYADEVENSGHSAVHRTLVDVQRRVTRILSELARQEKAA